MDRARQSPGELGIRSGLDFPRPVRFGRDYWLCRCVGYRVVHGAQVGTVESLSFGRRHDRPDALVVRLGRLRPRRTIVPVEDVEEILPRERQLVLRRRATES